MRTAARWLAISGLVAALAFAAMLTLQGSEPSVPLFANGTAAAG